MTKHLYIHLPFCKNICTYCDFVRIQQINPTVHKTYLDLILKEVKNNSILHQYSTIYLGGGTPNVLNDENLNYLLSNLVNYLDLNNDYEFCIELNPDSVTKSQVAILKQNKINRVSLGVQTTNDAINLFLHRYSKLSEVIATIKWLRQVGITNISCDFMYNLPLLTINDLNNAFKFIKEYNLPHVSFYALELKPNSILTKQAYFLDENIEQDQYAYINQKLQELGYERYEVASYTNCKKYSKHNLGYWLNEDWKGIGSGAYGFENGHYYSYLPNFTKLVKEDKPYTKKELYQHLLIMGLRTKFGLDLNIKINLDAYQYFYDELKNYTHIENSHLVINKIDFLDDCLIQII